MIFLITDIIKNISFCICLHHYGGFGQSILKYNNVQTMNLYHLLYLTLFLLSFVTQYNTIATLSWE